MAFCSSKKCNIHYEEKLLVTANCVEVCLLKVMCRGLCCLFVHLFNRKNSQENIRLNVSVWVLFRETSPASGGPDVVPKSLVCCVSFTVAGFQHVVTLGHSFVVSEAGRSLHMLN